ncbi:hypothetical protein ScPMuIL_011205 [Solemya velum]
MVAIDIRIVCLVLALIPLLSAAMNRRYYPKLCNTEYAECLQGDPSRKLQCGRTRVVCLVKYCTIQVKSVMKHERRNKFVVQRSIAKCLVKYPAARMSEMIVEFGD